MSNVLMGIAAWLILPALVAGCGNAGDQAENAELAAEAIESDAARAGRFADDDVADTNDQDGYDDTGEDGDEDGEGDRDEDGDDGDEDRHDVRPGSALDAGNGSYPPSPGSSAARNGRALPRGVRHLQKAVIVDASGFEQPMAAATLFLPHDWTPQGGVFWGSEFMCTNGYVFDWMAVSADGRSSIAVLPQEAWEWNNYGAPPTSPGCRIASFTDVRQYLEALAQRWRPGSRILEYRPRQDLELQFASYNSHTPTAMGEMRRWVEAGELHVAFEDRGLEMRGSVAAVAVFSLMRTNPGGGMGVMDAVSGSTFPAYAVAAPRAEFDGGFFEAIRRSIKADPQWDSRISQHNTSIARSALSESRKRAEMIARSNEEISRIREQAWSAYQESSDRRFREFGEVLRGVETYDDANAPTGQVELSNQYGNAWRLNDGSYVLSDDASFDPWRDLGVEGQRLEATR